MLKPRDAGQVIEIPGPWRHRYVAANGARFHVAEASAGGSDAPLVLLLHGFPEFWWAWRDQLPALAGAGYRAVAMDLRGYGGSDKTPRGYDPMTLAQDVSGVVKALGARSAIVVGHGWGGYVGWATAALHPAQVSALCAVSAPHPLAMLRGLRGRPRLRALRHVLAMQVPMAPERRIANPDSGFLRAHMDGWCAPGSGFPDEETLATYQEAIGIWPSSHCALEYHRWLFRSRIRSDGAQFNRAMRRPLGQPVGLLYGDQDPVVPASAYRVSKRWVIGELSEAGLAGAGHYPHEERPAELTGLLLGWLKAAQAS